MSEIPEIYVAYKEVKHDYIKKCLGDSPPAEGDV
jgi:hypothetical protein